MSNNETQNSKRLYFIALVLSLLVHAFSLIIFIAQKNKEETSQKIVKKADEKIYLKVLTETKKSKSDKKLQIVENEKSELNKKSDTRFLSHSNQMHLRQTIAKKIGKFQEARKGEKQKSEAGAKTAREQSKTKNLRLAEIGINKKTTLIPKIEKEGLEIGQGLASHSQSSDYIDDVPLGDMTRLNTIEYKYYGFYHRIRQKLEQYWGTSLREKADILAKKGKRMPSSSEKVTSLAIVLDDKGNIMKIYLKGTSGVQELDDAAIESFYKAGPFPNPPRGLIINGTARIEWGFVVKS